MIYVLPLCRPHDPLKGLILCDARRVMSFLIDLSVWETAKSLEHSFVYLVWFQLISL